MNVLKKVVERHSSRLDFKRNPARALSLLLIVGNHCNLLESGSREDKLRQLQSMGFIAQDKKIKSISISIYKFLTDHYLNEGYYDEADFIKKLGRVQANRVDFSSARGQRKNESRIRRRAEIDHEAIAHLLKSMIECAQSLQEN